MTALQEETNSQKRGYTLPNLLNAYNQDDRKQGESDDGSSPYTQDTVAGLNIVWELQNALVTPEAKYQFLVD